MMQEHTHKKGTVPIKRSHHRRGAAMLLVLIAVAVATILALSFLAAQRPTAVVASNIDRKAKARQIAESALKMAIDYVNEDADWRTDKTSGTWMADASLDGGTFTLTGIDEADGDLADDNTDVVTLSVVATYQGVTHRVSARVTPSTQDSANNLLLVVGNGSSPSTRDQAKQTLFESWGFTVTVIDDGASQSAYDDAVALNDVVYVSEEVSSSNVGTKLRGVLIGVVCDQSYLHDDFGFTTSDTTSDSSATAIDIADNGHPITDGFSTGSLTILSSWMNTRYVTSSLASGVTVLGDFAGGSSAGVLMVADVGDTLHYGSATGRRVMFPASDDVDVTALNDDGKTLLRRSLEWATGGSSSGLQARWFDLSSSPSDLGDVPWTSTPTQTTAEADIDWPSTSSTWLSGFPSEDFAVELTGSITVPSDGAWTFYLESDDGSELVIDGSTVIDNDGLHGMVERSGSVSLTAGTAYPIRVRYFENSADAGLILRWSGPGQSKQVVPASAFAGSASEEEGATPQLVALYEFEQVTVAPTLAGRWSLNESSSGSSGSVLMTDNVELSGGAIIDAYDSADGVYGGTNQQRKANIVTNATDAGAINLTGNSTVHGHVTIGSGGSLSSVVSVESGSQITGNTAVQNTNQSITSVAAPTGSFGTSLGDMTYASDQTWSSNMRFDNLSISSGATITISGDVEIDVTASLNMTNGHIVLEPGATLKLWVNDQITLNSNATINNDTSRPNDTTIIVYGTAETDDMWVYSGTIVAAIKAGDDVFIYADGEIYGSIISEDDLEIYGGAFHADLSTSPAAPVPSTLIARDDSDLGNDGAVYNGPVGGVAGQLGTAFEFDGNNDYVEIPHDDSYLMQAGTFSVWFKTDTTSGQRGLFSKDSSGYDTGGHFSVWLNGSRIEVRMQSTTASNFVRSASGSISTGQWYHVMFAWGEEGMALYLNGVLVDTNAYTGGMGTSSGGVGNYEPIVLGANAWKTGNFNSSGLEGYFDGVLDDFRLYNERLSESQAAEIYAGADEPSPFLSEAIVEDTSGFGDPLDLAVQDTDPVTWSGGGLTFDSDTLAVSLAPGTKLHDAIETTGEFSVEMILQRASPGSTASPSRIVAMSEGAGDSNLVFGQDGGNYEARVRDSSTGGSGVLSPEFISSTTLGSGDTHAVLSYKDGEVTVYIDGVLDESQTAGGVLNNWESDHFLVFGGAYGGSSFWRGTLKRVAIYDRALNDNQAQNVYNGNDPGDGTTPVGEGKAVWDEED